MDYAYRMYKNVRYYYEQINPATLSGAIDVIVVEQPNGDFHSTPFHVRFGKYGVFNYKEKYVDVSINGKECKDIRMKLGENGIAFFVEETSGVVPDYLVTSPVPGLGNRPTTDKVLAETSRTLAKHLADGRRGTKPISIGGGRTPPAGSPPPGIATSPTSVLRRSKSVVRGKDAEKLMERRTADDEKLTIQERKMTLPMLDSIFSMRRNRSLPNLSAVGLDTDDFTPTNAAVSSSSKKVSGAPTVSAAAAASVAASVGAPAAPPSTPNAHKTPQRRPREKRVRATKSQILERKKPTETDDKKKREGSTSSSSDSGSTTPVQSKSSPFTPSSPIAINVSPSRDDDRAGLSSSSSSTLSSPGLPSLLDAADAARIAEGALSDTEVERHKRDGAPMEQHGSDVAEWSWGQFPKTMDEQKKEKEPEKPKSSSWWWWRSSGASNTPDKKSRDGGAEESEGIYLDDLLKQSDGADPNKLQRYIGRPSSQSMDADSGNGSGLTTSPSSPSARSLPDDVVEVTAEEGGFEDKTPTQETVASALPHGASIDEGKEGKKQRTTSEIFSMSEDEDVTQDGEEFVRDEKTGMTYFRSLRLSSDRLKTLGLQWGANECRFSITTKFQGTTWCACNIYLYKHAEKIVISDIDGTITKSDVLGHVIPAIGGQWAHAGVAELYTRIKSNGYKLVYLSSRAIGQASITKKYLKTVEQDQRVLPDGPVLLAPDSVLVAFRREVIERRPEEFKIAALSDLKKLFPTKRPFFAGFGNRETDTKSYRAVGIDDSRILIIDPSGTVKRSDCVGYKSSYKCMAQDSVDCIFPPILDERAQKKPNLTALSFSRPQTNSSYTFWQSDRGNVSDDELAKYEAGRKKKK